MGCLPHALLTTIKDAADRGGDRIPPLLCAAPASLLPGDGGDWGTGRCPALPLPSHIGRAAPALPQDIARSAAWRWGLGRRRSPGSPRASGSRASTGQKAGQEGSPGACAAGHGARAQPLTPPGCRVLLQRCRPDPTSLIQEKRCSVGFLPQQGPQPSVNVVCA